MKLTVEDKKITIGNCATVILNQTLLSSIDLGMAPRTQSLDYGISLSIFDRLGMRIWSRAGIIYQVSAVFATDSENTNMPSHSYEGTIDISITGMTIAKHSCIDELADALSMKLDQERLKYKVKLYSTQQQDPILCVWLNSDGQIAHVFISTPI